MSPVDDHLSELAATLHVRGRARRRFLAECRDHLLDASAEHGPAEAVRRFGDAGDLARSYDTEVAARRTLRATVGAVVGVAAVAGSTLALIHAADAGAAAVPAWAVAFFGFAQTSAVCVGLALLQAAALRRTTTTAADLALLHRRNLAALVFAGLTFVSAGGAVSGHASAWILLGGPGVGAVALAQIARARRLARTIEAGPRIVRPPVTDLLVVLGRDGAARIGARLSGARLLVTTTLLASVLAFVWSMRDDRGTAGVSVVVAGIEAALTVAGFVVLGPVLGLWRRSGRPALGS